MKTPIYFSSLAIALLIGSMIGYFFSPEYVMASSNRSLMAMELGQADRFVDLRYIDGMIAHHQSAIYMLNQAQQKSTKPEIQKLAETVITADTADINQLYQMKKDWYNNTRQVTQFNKINLGEANETFDLRLLNALVEHHIEAIAKAKEVRTKSTKAETLDRANNVIKALSDNRTQLEQWREDWYGN